MSSRKHARIADSHCTRPASVASFAIPLLMGAVAAGGLSCERIGFYSTGRSSPDPAPSVAASSGGGGSPTARTALFEAVATCSVELLDSFQGAAEKFESAAAVAASDPTAQEKAREAWADAMDVWQRAELFQFGPAGPSSTPGGQGLRDHIYSWPLVSRCLVEQAIVSKAYEAEGFGDAALVNTRGLAAAEYLLFYTGGENACSPSTDINANGAWTALSPADLASRKARYASVIAANVAERARGLAKAWSPSGGDFKGQLVSAGQGGSVYATEQAALNAISDAIFYIESVTKDLKLARPLGLADCDNATCPENLESRFAGRSKQNIRNNLLGLRMLVAGCEDGDGKGVGFDDLLISTGAPELASKLTAAVDNAIAAVDAIKVNDLAQALQDDLAHVQGLHAAVKQITDLLKTELVSVLDLELPQQVEGDND